MLALVRKYVFEVTLINSHTFSQNMHFNGPKRCRAPSILIIRAIEAQLQVPVT